MSFKLFVLAAAVMALSGCVSAPYSPDTGYTQGYAAHYDYAPGYYSYR